MKIERNRGIKKQKIKSISIKSCALLMSEVSHLILIIIIVLIGIIFPSHHKAVTYYSKSSNISWNSTADPLIFTHLSDIHITFFNNLKKYEDLFKAAKNLNASFHLLTGDLVDNYKKRHFPKVGKQNKKDWKIYKYLLDTYLYNETIIDNSGNHDMFGVISPLRKKYGFLDVSKSFNRNNTEFLNKFLVKTVTIEGINFILINPYNFPTVHPPYGFYPQTTKKLLDLLENEINKYDSCCILHIFQSTFFGGRNLLKGILLGKL
jgi:predicted MPP superfamily phosphohydrolase